MKSKTVQEIIPSNWKTVSFSEIVEVSGGSTPDSKNQDYWNGDIPWLTPKDITKGTTVHIKKTSRKISQLGLEKGPRIINPIGCILMSSRAPVGVPVINDIPMAVNQGFIVINCKNIDKHFLYYWIKNNVDYLKNSSNGTTFLELSKSIFKTLQIKLPEKIEEQKKIGEYIYNFDRKIESLQNQNEILEQMAQAIFKSWFVDFDGVTEFDNSELGQIPKGWTTGYFSEISKITSGKRPDFISEIQTELYPVPLYGASGIMGYVRNALYQKPIILTGRVGTIGVIQNIFEDCYPSDNTLVIVPTDDFFHQYIVNFLKTVDFDSIKGGSTQPLITQTSLKSIGCIIPERNILEKFERFMTDIQLYFEKNKKQIQFLTKIRNSLLPKLMSGEIRV